VQMKAVSAWKEAALLVSAGAVIVTGIVRRARWVGKAPYSEVVGLLWLGMIAVQAVIHLERGVFAQLFGARDWLLYLLPFFIGLHAPLDDVQAKNVFRALIIVGVATSVIGVVEYIAVPTAVHVEIGVPRYFRDLLGQKFNPVYGGLPFNYWGTNGFQTLRRAVSVYLSGQGFAIPFLIFMPASILWLLRRRSAYSMAAVALSALALALTFTRMTIVVCALQAAVLMWMHGYRRMLGLAAAAVFVVFIAAWIVSPNFQSYVTRTVTMTDGSSSTRPKYLLYALKLLREEPFGSGLGTSGQSAVQLGNNRGNWATEFGYGKAVQTFGAPGLVLWFAWFIGILRYARKVLERGTDMQRCMGMLVLATAGGFMINNLTAPPDQSPIVMVLFGWLAGTVAAWAGRSGTVSA